MARPSKQQAEVPKPAPEPPDAEKLMGAELVAFVASNPFAHLTHGQIRDMFVIGQKTMTDLGRVKPHFPQIASKINPAHFQRWLWENREAIAAQIGAS